MMGLIVIIFLKQPKYLYQILFWAIFAYFAPIILGYNQFNVPDLCFNLINFSSWNWFILSYLGLYLFAPMLECFIKNISQKQLSYFLLAFYCFSTIYGWILQVSPEFQEGTTFVSLIGLYLIGAYIRKYNLNVLRFKKIYDLLIYFGIGILLVILSVIALRFKITSSLYGYLNPLIIIESVYLFLFFKKLDIRYNKFINWVAASAFAVYLFHYNPNIFVFYSNICKYIQINFSYSFFAAILFMILIFIVAVLIDKIRIWSFNLIYKQICPQPLPFHKSSSIVRMLKGKCPRCDDCPQFQTHLSYRAFHEEWSALRNLSAERQ